jgi:hypothetical protein
MYHDVVQYQRKKLPSSSLYKNLYESHVIRKHKVLNSRM